MAKLALNGTGAQIRLAHPAKTSSVDRAIVRSDDGAMAERVRILDFGQSQENFTARTLN
jgi:hypothetical protein